MTEDADILRMNIQRYEGLLKLNPEKLKREQIVKMLAEAQADLQEKPVGHITTAGK